jgi:hypothetical protein
VVTVVVADATDGVDRTLEEEDPVLLLMKFTPLLLVDDKDDNGNDDDMSDMVEKKMRLNERYLEDDHDECFV